MPESIPTDAAVSSNRLLDFSSRLSPMVVKELRQGMRTNLFVTAFILLQAFMILCVLAGLASPGSNDASGFFWFFIIATLLVIQPLRGFSALSSETQLNTMDLIQLTRLDSWRITAGKWAALNAQGLLFCTGVLPYLVIRYFLGNVNFVLDLLALLVLALGSAFATAITIGSSVFSNIIVRGTILAAMAVLLMLLGAWTIQEIFDRFRMVDMSGLGLLAVSMLFGIFFFLSFGASRIAPLSENQSTRKRLIALGAVAIVQAFWFSQVDSALIVVVTALILGVTCIDAITEPTPIYSRVAQRFASNPLLRLAAIFLTPGWISGLFFFLFSASLLFGLLYFIPEVTEKPFSDIESAVLTLSICNTVLFPVLLIQLFFAKRSTDNFTFAIYLFFQAGLLLTTIMVVAIAEAVRGWEETVYLLGALPSVLIVGVNEANLDEPIYLVIVIVTTILCVLVPLLRQSGKVKEFFGSLFA